MPKLSIAKYKPMSRKCVVIAVFDSICKIYLLPIFFLSNCAFMATIIVLKLISGHIYWGTYGYVHV